MSGYRKGISKWLAGLSRENVAPWQGGGRSDGLYSERPYNPVTDKDYNGINSIILSAEMTRNEPHDPRFVTRTGAMNLGYEIYEDLGIEGVSLECWLFEKQYDVLDSDNKPVLDSDGLPTYEMRRCPQPEVFYATVFHVSDLEGFDVEPHREKVSNDHAWLELSKMAQVVNGVTDKSYYSKDTDMIYMPAKDRYENGNSYDASVAFHLCESVFHKMGVVENIDLRAQILLSLLSAGREDSPVPTEFIKMKNHAAFIDNDHNAIYRAATSANQAISWLNEIERRPEIEAGIADDIKRTSGANFKVDKKVELFAKKQLTDFIKAQGLEVSAEGLVMDGKWHKVATIGEETGVGGCYRGSLDGTVVHAEIVNNSTRDLDIGLWVYTGEELDSKEVVKMKEKEEEIKSKRIARQEAYDKLVGDKASSIYNKKTVGATLENCPYLNKEKIQVGDVGYSNAPKCTSDGSLVVDMRDINGELRSLLFIDAEKETFLNNYCPKGAYHLVYGASISEGPDHAPSVIVKDFTQAVRMHNASGLSVAVAFHEDNIAPVYASLKDRYPEAQIVIGVDKANGLEKKLSKNIKREGHNISDVIVENTPDLNRMLKEKGPIAVSDYVEINFSPRLHAQSVNRDKIESQLQDVGMDFEM